MTAKRRTVEEIAGEMADTLVSHGSGCGCKACDVWYERAVPYTAAAIREALAARDAEWRDLLKEGRELLVRIDHDCDPNNECYTDCCQAWEEARAEWIARTSLTELEPASLPATTLEQIPESVVSEEPVHRWGCGCGPYDAGCPHRWGKP